jgi:hypothetical protein
MAIQFIQYDDNYVTANATTIANDSALNTTTGNLIVVAVKNYNISGYATVSSIADTAENSYTKAKDNDGLFTSIGMEIWYAKNITGNANNIITVTFSKSTGNRYISVAEFSGADKTSPLIGTAAQTNGNTRAHSSGNVESVNIGDLLIGHCGNSGSAVNYTAGTGFTALSSDLTLVFDFAEYKILSAKGWQAATCATSDNVDSNMLAALFKPLKQGPFPTFFRT